MPKREDEIKMIEIRNTNKFIEIAKNRANHTIEELEKNADEADKAYDNAAAAAEVAFRAAAVTTYAYVTKADSTNKHWAKEYDAKVKRYEELVK